MTPIFFTHANTKRQVIVTREMVFAIQHSEAHKCTHLISTAGAVIPVSESVEHAKGLVYKLLPNEKGETNGRIEGTSK